MLELAFSQVCIARLLPPEDGGQDIPLPVVLDTRLRFRLDSKLLANYKTGKGRQPTIFTSAEALKSDSTMEERRKQLEAEGVKVIPISTLDSKRVCLDIADLY